MKYQLVSPILVLFDGRLRSFDFDRKIRISEGLGDLGVVDGHDVGADEMDVFIHTDNPKLAFDRARALLGAGDNLQKLKAAFRGFGEEKYVVIYPNGLSHFSVA
jgi:hypothetical protein